jgi:transcriptional regulator with XRE-family HTH domain
METFGQRIKRVRSERNLTAKQLAGRLKISLPYLSQLEGDLAIPSEELARKIANSLDQDAEEVLFHARRIPEQLAAILTKFPNAAASFLGGGRRLKRRLEPVRLTATQANNEAPLGTLGPTLPLPVSEPRMLEKAGSLVETFEIVRPSIVAFASKVTMTELGGVPVFPDIVGTGFVVDSRGIVITNAHVVRALEALPRHPVTGARSDMAMVWAHVEAVGEGHTLPVVFADVKASSIIRSFVPNGPFFGEDLPDIAFVQLNVREIPALKLSTEPCAARMGLPVATAGFPLGTDPLVVHGKVTQVTPFLRHGIISSLNPFPCPYPHGFTVDIMSQGGASGSPVFLTDHPTVIGMVYAGFPGTNVTMAIPSNLLSQALAQCGEPLGLENVPTLEDYLRKSERSAELKWESFVFMGKTNAS